MTLISTVWPIGTPWTITKVILHGHPELDSDLANAEALVLAVNWHTGFNAVPTNTSIDKLLGHEDVKLDL